MMDKLKPCPFCGSDQIIVWPDYEFGDVTWDVMCKACGVHVRRDLEEQAIAAWNTRTQSGSNENVG
jgi:Lar family restriction alleviation protein